MATHRTSSLPELLGKNGLCAEVLCQPERLALNVSDVMYSRKSELKCGMLKAKIEV